MSALQHLLDTSRATAVTESEKGTYFERLVKAYSLELFLCVITASLETMQIVRALPNLDIRADG